MEKVLWKFEIQMDYCFQVRRPYYSHLHNQINIGQILDEAVTADTSIKLKGSEKHLHFAREPKHLEQSQ